jgi:hypothetical protein
LTGIWKYRVLEIGQPHPFFQLPWARRESSGSGRRHESMQPECSNADSKTPGCRMHSLPILLGLPESRISWRTEERWRWLSGLPVMPIVGRPNFTTDVGRGFYSKTWSGFDTDFKTVPEEYSVNRRDETMPALRDQLFISYSYKDREWLSKLQTMLNPLARKPPC